MALNKTEQLNETLQQAIGSYHAGQLTQAIAQLEGDSKRFPKSPKLWGYLGFLYSERGAETKAIRAFRNALRLSPRSEQASLGLFHSLWRAGRMDDAFHEMRRFMKSNDSPRYLELLRDMLSESKRAGLRRKSA